MKVIFIVGIFGKPFFRVSKGFRIATERLFPGASFVVALEEFGPFSFAKMRAFADRIVEEHDTGEDILFIGYSMGGIIASAIAPRFKKSKVLLVATVFAPHTFLWDLFSKKLCSNLNGLGNIPVISFVAKYDWCVGWGARYPRAVAVYEIQSDHLVYLLFSPRPAREIISRILQHIQKA